MSSRQLRKLQKQRELEETPGPELESSEEDEEAPEPTRRTQLNLFAALGGDDDDRDDDDDDDDDDENDDDAGAADEADRRDAQQEKDVDPTPAEPIPPPKSKKKKKNKKGKKGKATPTVSRTAREEEEEEEDEAGDEGDEIDRAIQELGLASNRNDTSSASHSAPRLGSGVHELLKVNTHHLKVIHEMRNLFGRDVIDAANAEEEQETARRGRQRQQQQQQVDLETFLKEPPWAKKLPEISLRRNVFIQGREHWPRATAGGLTMAVVGKSEDGVSNEYAYSYDKEYDEAQIIFFTLVQVGDPMQLVRYLKQTPYHISTLLQVSSVAKQDQNMALAAELCERALFTFGRMTTSAFRKDIESGRARLDFRRPENRQFWLAGYHYIKSLIRKGTYRTALEWAKLVFAMDPKDPYAMRHFLHFLAIRSYEPSWLLGFLDELEGMSGAGDAVYLQQTRVLALLQKGDAEQARSHLAEGMRRVPWLYCCLFQELNLDAPPSIWGISAATDTRTFWVKLYLHQAKGLWNNTQATDLLLSVAKSLDRVNTADLPPDDAPIDRGSVRFAFLEGQTGLIASAPRDILDSQPNYEFDPLPPPEEENIFTSAGTRVAWQANAGRTTVMNMVARLAAQQEDLHRRFAEEELDPAALQELGIDVLEEVEEEMVMEPAHLDYESAMREAAAAAEGDESGLIAGLMRMLGMRSRNREGEIGAEEGGEEGQEGRGALPGAWPEVDAGVYDFEEEGEGDARSDDERR